MTDIWYRSPRINVNSHQNSWNNVASLPQPGALIFSAPLTSSITPTVGTGGSFARASSINYADTLSTINTKTSGNACIPAFPFNGVGASGGIQLQGVRNNLCTRSEDLTNAAWTTIGSLSVRANSGGTSPNLSITSTTQLTASAVNSGVQFDTGVAAASKTFCFSIYSKKTFGGTTPCTIKVKDNGAEVASTSYTADNALWKRVDVSITFSAGAVGNCFVQCLIDSNAQSIMAWGAQIEQLDNVSFPTHRNAKPSPYITSNAGSTTSSAADNLNYPSSNINPALGTISGWICPPCSETQISAGAAHTLFSMNNLAIAFYLTTNNLDLEYNTSSLTFATSWTANTWMHLACSFDDANNLRAIYKNGASVATSAAAITAPGAATFNVGNFGSLDEAIDGMIGNVHIWNVKLSDADVTTIFNVERAQYGV